MSLIDCLRTVPDPRSERNRRHDVVEILVCLILGYTVGKVSIRKAMAWCGRNIKWIKRYLTLKNGVASVPTASRILSRIDGPLFLYAFMEWIGERLETRGIHLIIDGKALRASAEKVKNGKVPYVLNAIDAGTGLVLAQLPVDSKTNEISMIPKLLSLLNLKGTTVTIDAIGTQTAVMEQIIESEGHFVLTVKKNHPATYEELMDVFKDLEAEKARMKREPKYQGNFGEQMKKYDEHASIEKNRGRMEYRYYKICNDTGLLSRADGDWYFIKSIGHVRQIRIKICKDEEGNDVTPTLEEFLEERRKQNAMATDEIDDDFQDVGIVSDMEMTAEEMGRIKREHWRIENSCHHILDDTMREDRSPAKKSKYNLALIRKFAYNILRLILNEHPEEKSIADLKETLSDEPDRMKKYIFEG